MFFFFGALPIDQSKIKHTKKLKEIPSRHFLENLPEKLFYQQKLQYFPVMQLDIAIFSMFVNRHCNIFMFCTELKSA